MGDVRQECETCRFWDGQDDWSVDAGDNCLRHPPAFIEGGWRFPQTRKGNWCGEWKGWSDDDIPHGRGGGYTKLAHYQEDH